MNFGTLSLKFYETVGTQYIAYQLIVFINHFFISGMLSENAFPTIFNWVMNRYGKGICESCHFAKKCTLHAPGETTWECSEYEPLVVFSETQSLFLKAPVYQDVSSNAGTLCKHCDQKDSCCYYSPEIFIFTCENYQ